MQYFLGLFFITNGIFDSTEGRGGYYFWFFKEASLWEGLIYKIMLYRILFIIVLQYKY